MDYKANKEIKDEFNEKWDKRMGDALLNYRNELKDFILEIRKQDREAIREWAMEKSYRKKVFGKKFLELTDLLSFLDGLEGE